MQENDAQAQLKTGRTMMLIAFGGYLIIGLFGKSIGLLATAVAMMTFAIAVFAAIKMSSGLEHSTLSKTIYAVCMLVPLVGLILMVTLTVRAHKAID